jgi:hypothetical protein
MIAIPPQPSEESTTVVGPIRLVCQSYIHADDPDAHLHVGEVVRDLGGVAEVVGVVGEGVMATIADEIGVLGQGTVTIPCSAVPMLSLGTGRAARCALAVRADLLDAPLQYDRPLCGAVR